MLDKFRKAKQLEINRLRKYGVPKPFEKPRADFMACLANNGAISVIAEYKRASPSLGKIRDDLSIEEAAAQYSSAGCSAISILTEKTYFDGDLSFLQRAHEYLHGKIPLLRKDFIFHELQIEATAATPASAALLIARMLENAKELEKLKEKAEGFGLAPVVEIFDENDLLMAREAGARIIQVNARNLQTLHTDKHACLEFINAHPPKKDEIWIAASGMEQPEDLQAAWRAGFRSALIGTALMKAESPGRKLAWLLQKK